MNKTSKYILLFLAIFIIIIFYPYKEAKSQFNLPVPKKTFLINYYSRRANYSWREEASNIAEVKIRSEKMMEKIEGKNWKKNYIGKTNICEIIP